MKLAVEAPGMLMSITSGTAHVAGIDVMADPDAARPRIGVALQEAGLDPARSPRDRFSVAEPADAALSSWERVDGDE